MAVEPRRGCGYRKVGGLYLVSGKLSAPCGGLPVPLCICPTCGAGIKQTRGWTWIDPRKLFGVERAITCGMTYCESCPVGNPPDEGGLIWVGEAFYKTPSAFMQEAAKLGVSRRVSTIPRGIEIGKTVIFAAHPKAVWVTNTNPDDELIAGGELKPGIITAFTPTAIEQIITQSQSQDAEFMASLDKRGITPVIVPDDDPDHQGSVYDKPDDDELELNFAH